MIRDALARNESCGGHFREEYQSPDGEALRNDHEYTYVAAWEWMDTKSEPVMNKEDLKFENIELKTRSYK
jgi:succinate dehydrogenase / fumarate reductase flavoprotein subunit